MKQKRVVMRTSGKAILARCILCTARALWLFQIFLLTACGHVAGVKDGDGGLNRLSDSDSPYLREHADNPVDWYEWGSEALQKARKENKPLIISIGYASCHWCHVMEEESFMDTAVARVMNENFVCIKIDREQRPDIDQIYLNAAELVSGNAGWPLNAFALPDGRPFYAGTYFPRDHWLELLGKVREAYAADKALLIKQAAALTGGVQRHELISDLPDSVSRIARADYVNVFDFWSASLDFDNGGLGGAPKFPMPVNWKFLLQYHALTGSRQALEIVTTTMRKMARGGIYDQIGGGFYRYATDAQWRIPHFEKMLYDNAQLVSLYAQAYRLTGIPLYKKVMEESLAFIAEELSSPEGAFYASLNADSEGEEGKFYVWTRDEVGAVLDGRTAALISGYYQVTDSGNWENGKNVLAVVKEDGFAQRNKLSPEEWGATLSRARYALKKARDKRVRPSRDEKVLTSWNALMISALTDAYLATGENRHLEAALKNAAFLERVMTRDDGGLWRNYHEGHASIEAFLDDYAFLAQAYIDLYQVTFDVHWLEEARSLAVFALAHFSDPNTAMCFYTSDRSTDLIARKMELTDQVIPSSSAVLATVLFQLGEYYQLQAFSVRSKMMLNHILQSRSGAERLFYAQWLILAGWFAYEPYEVAVMGERAASVASELRREYHPVAIFLGGIEENLPLLHNKLVAGKTIIYVCRNRICRLPVEDVEQGIALLGRDRGE